MPTAFAHLVMPLENFVPRIQTISLSGEFTLDILRLDEIHPYISGNKWYKLKYNLIEALNRGAQCIITYGGAYSNHLVAAACAAQLLGLRCVCIVRGEEPLTPNPRLQYIKAMGAILHFVSRSSYKIKEQSDDISDIISQYPHSYLIAEGGANPLGFKGCTQIINDVAGKYDIIACTAGTGTMAAGIAATMPPGTKLLVFPAISFGNISVVETGLYKDVIKYLENPLPQIEFNSEYTFGGYAKTNETLNQFITYFSRAYDIALDSVYNAKMFFGLTDMLGRRLLPRGARILAIHCGGVFAVENKMIP